MIDSNARYRNARNTLSKWKEAIEAMDGGTDRDRDSAILRFELSFEVVWKYIQDRVRANGLESNGPRQAFENAFTLGWIEDECLYDEILKKRNLATHVYKEELANTLVERLPQFYEAMKNLVDKAAES
jgi:nucleotidyltransferase substrate binding protein (TIGR01987 family)